MRIGYTNVLSNEHHELARLMPYNYITVIGDDVTDGSGMGHRGCTSCILTNSVHFYNRKSANQNRCKIDNNLVWQHFN